MLTRVVFGNDFTIRINVVQPQYTIDGTIYEDFDLTKCTDVEVNLICEQHKIIIPLNWILEENANNIILADIIGKQLHIGSVYGVQITGLDENNKAWRYKNKSVFSVVDATKDSLMDIELMDEPLELRTEISLFVNAIPIEGHQGPAGSQGPQGQTGQQGEKGQDGQPGVQGSQGPQGQTGQQGEKGQDGQPGVQGETGPQGQDGQPGVQGSQGAQGETGPQGQDGQPGVQGSQGAQGNQGAQGEIDYTILNNTYAKIEDTITPDLAYSTFYGYNTGDNGLWFDYHDDFNDPDAPAWVDDRAIFICNWEFNIDTIQCKDDYADSYKINGVDYGRSINWTPTEYTWHGDMVYESDITINDKTIYKANANANRDFAPHWNVYWIRHYIYHEVTFKVFSLFNYDNRVAGPQGEQGPQGQDGQPGEQGSQGAQGSAGPQGQAGQQGEKGQDGQPGEQGSQGAQGPQGIPGINGIDGINGQQGERGVQGPQGTAGVAPSNCVTSTTNGLKIEVVNVLPVSPSNDTIYIVS